MTEVREPDPDAVGEFAGRPGSGIRDAVRDSLDDSDRSFMYR
ncbi:hypothetical protein [Salinirubellus litoreus]